MGKYICFYYIIQLGLIWRLGQVLPVWFEPHSKVSFKILLSPWKLPCSWSCTGSSLSWNIANGKKFGSQELLIERLLGCSLGIELTQILQRGLIITIQSPNVAQHVLLEDNSAQFYSNGSILLKFPMFSHSRGQLLKLPVHRESGIVLPGHSSPKVLVSSTAVKSFS